MKKAKVSVVTVNAVCPSCGGDVPDPESGSLYIDVNQYNKEAVFSCSDCGEKFQLESKAWK